MAKLKPVVLKSKIGIDGKTNIKIRLTHDGKSREISTPWYIDPKYMSRDGIISSKYPGAGTLNMAINMMLVKYNLILSEMGPEIIYTDINTILKKLRGPSVYGSTFTSYLKYRIDQLKKENRSSYAESYQVTLLHLESFTGKSEIDFKEITISFLRDFEGYLRQSRGVRTNTVRIYLNNIRSLFNHAIEAGIIRADLYPFRKFKIAQEKSIKRPLSIDDLKKLLLVRTTLPEGQKRAVDIFFLSFYLIGINLKDLLYLRPENVYKDRLFYGRFKTGREYSIRIFPQAQEIIDCYRGEKYLLRFLEEKKKITPASRRGIEHKDILNNTNKHLRIVAKKIGLNVKLSTYFARYSWATIAAELDTPFDVISRALGHEMGNPTTAIYINFNIEKVDRANEKVINAVKN